MYKIKNLVSNYNSGTNLIETLKKIFIEIKKLEDDYSDEGMIAWKNLIKWKNKYIKKINKIKGYLETATQTNGEGIIKFIESYIASNGLKFEGIEINKFYKKRKTDVGIIDLIGHTKNEKYIIEVKNCPAKSDVIGQVLGYWQYLKEADNKEYTIIIIAPSFTNKYQYTIKAKIEYEK
ncbi:hypothetical protein ES708_30590 [subsurface metagenome]